MVPNATYAVARNGASIGPATASSQGVVTFRSAAGGVFTMQSQGGGTVPSAPKNLRIIGADAPARGRGSKR
jgi:hypothetical protein